MDYTGMNAERMFGTASQYDMVQNSPYVRARASYSVDLAKLAEVAAREIDDAADPDRKRAAMIDAFIDALDRARGKAKERALDAQRRAGA